jgi:hypothetical protein
MCPNVLAGNVGTEYLIPVAVAIQDEAHLPALFPFTVPSGTQEQS